MFFFFKGDINDVLPTSVLYEQPSYHSLVSLLHNLKYKIKGFYAHDHHDHHDHDHHRYHHNHHQTGSAVQNCDSR